MKKFISKILPACVIVIVILLILLVLLSCDEDMPSYSFLGGRNPVSYEEFNKKSWPEDRWYIYSFEADFNDVCSKADAELLPMGFVERTLPGSVSWEHTYWLKGSFPRAPIRIIIHNHPGNVEEDDTLAPKEGWVGVTVIYIRGWWWPF